MSVLSDLKLAYETLADDPIDMGIYYGHSILNLASRKLAPSPQLAYATVPTSPQFTNQPSQSRYTSTPEPVEPVYSSAPEPAAPVIQPSSREQSAAVSLRRDYTRYISRSPVSRATSSYTQRNMIGAI